MKHEKKKRKKRKEKIIIPNKKKKIFARVKTELSTEKKKMFCV